MDLIKKFPFIIILALFLTSCSRSESEVPGYIEGEYTYISSGAAGTLFNLYVTRGQTVQRGELLYKLDPEPEKSDVEASQANIGDMEAQVHFAEVQLKRQKTLYPGNATTKADLDEAQQIFNSRSQQLSANKAQYIHSQWALNQKTVYAPISGIVFDTFYRVGEKVPENRPVLAILAPENIKVLFYIPETELSRIKLGQEIHFSCDSCQAVTAAKITYISPEAEYTPPVIYSKDTRHKLVYRIRASMPANTAIRFHPGQPIDVRLP